MKLVEINCPVCNDTKSSDRWKVGDWKVVQCGNCGFRFTNPRPDDLSVFYDEDYFKDHRHRKKFFDDEGNVISSSGSYWNRISDIEHYSTKRGRILEVGAARGEFLNAMKLRGWTASGIEISEDAVLKAKELFDLDLHRGMMEDYSSQELFDAVVMYQTLEHVTDPKYIVERSYELLNKEGILLIEVPNTDSFDFRTNRKRRTDMLDLPRHLNHFNSKSLIKLVENAGFEIMDIDLYMPNFLLKLQDLWFGMKSKKEAGENKREQKQATTIPMAKKYQSGKLKMIQKITKIFPGWRITVIARKP